MPLRHWASALAGRISPARVSASSSVGLDDDVVVQRLEREAGSGACVFQHAFTILPEMPESPFVELEVGSRTVKVSNPDKIYFRARGGRRSIWSSTTWLSATASFVRCSSDPHLKRHPEGAEGEAIYQKRVPEKRPDWVQTAPVDFPSGRHADELCVTEVASVAWAANLGTLDFHPGRLVARIPSTPTNCASTWIRSRAPISPTRVMWQGRCNELLDELGWIGWPKTSGNRGLHVYVRIEPNCGHFLRYDVPRSRSLGRSSGECRIG